MTNNMRKELMARRRKKIMERIEARRKTREAQASAKKTASSVRKAAVERRAAMHKAGVYASRMASKLDARMEKILLDAEELVKEFFPARYVSASLTKLQKILKEEGITCAFDKRVSRQSIKKTASSTITAKECSEAIQKIAEAVVDETEDTLEQCDSAIKTLAKKHFQGRRVSASLKMRSDIEETMRKTGLNFKF